MILVFSRDSLMFGVISLKRYSGELNGSITDLTVLDPPVRLVGESSSLQTVSSGILMSIDF
jgi:hypothetical protein